MRGKVFTIVTILLLIPFTLAESNKTINPENLTKNQITQLVKENVNKVNLSKAGGFVNWIFQDSTININFTKNNKQILYGFEILDKKIENFQEKAYENYDYELRFNFEELIPAFQSENPVTELKKAYSEEKIVLKANSFKAKIVKFLAGMIMSFLPDNFEEEKNSSK